MLNCCTTKRSLQVMLHICIGCCLASLFWLFPAHTQTAQAYPQELTREHSQPTLRVDLGFEDMRYRSGYWTPVHITLDNPGPDFTGTLAVNAITGTGLWGAPVSKQSSPWQFAEALLLPRGTHKQITLDVPLYLANTTPRGVSASLRDEAGKTVATQTVSSTSEIITGSFFVGLLSNPNTNFDALDNTNLPPNDETLTLSTLDASTFPTMDAVLENFDVIVLDDFDSTKLRPDQLLALQTWVNRGGVLIETGGAQWNQTLSSLPDTLLPVKLHGTDTLPIGTQLWSPKSPDLQSPEQQLLAQPLLAPTTISTATVSDSQAFSASETILASGSTPLIVQAHQGQGVICYLAFDPTDQNLTNWPGITPFWNLLLTRALGDHMLIPSSADPYYTGPGQVLTRAGVLNMIVPEVLPGPLVLFICLIGYALFLGPLRLLLMRKLQLPRWWSGRLLLGSIVLFVLLTYPFSLYERNASITDNSISIMQVNQNGSSAHSTTYSGIFVPNAGNFNLHIPGESLAQPVATQFLSMLNNPTTTIRKDTTATIVAGSNDTNVNLQGLSPWSLQYTIAEQDLQLPGTITTHLSLQGQKLVGTVTNTLHTDLSDIYILFPHGFVSIGHIAAGATQQVNLPLFTTSAQSGQSLEDQITAHAGIAEMYFPYSNKFWTAQSDLQRHIALLSALNGAGFSFQPCQNSCKYHAVTNRNTLAVTGGRVPNPAMTEAEPLILNNAPATLIAWANQPVTNDVTINGWHPVGQRESFLQMPINVALPGPDIPSGLISGQVEDVQGFSIEMDLPGIYTMNEGSITFELTIPTLASVHSMTVTEPDLWAHPFGPTPNSSGNISHLQAQLYNWQTGNWDLIPLNEDSFTTANLPAYVGPAGHVLLQVTNQDTTQGKLYFGRPTLRLNKH